MAGKRVNLAALAGQPVLNPAAPAGAGTAHTVRLDQVAANPLNTRVVAESALDQLAASLREHGQLQPCAVVTRAAFVAIFPEHAESVGQVAWVQVTGGRRAAAARRADLTTLDVVVRDALARDRAGFIAATAAENIDRAELDPIEEAAAVELLAAECGSATAAARLLARTDAWVSQRRALLSLTDQMQQLVRAREVPIRDAREIARMPGDEQHPEWLRRAGGRELTAVNEPVDPPAAREGHASSPRLSRRAAAVRRLGETPQQLAESLRAELSADVIAELIELLGSNRQE